MLCTIVGGQSAASPNSCAILVGLEDFPTGGGQAELALGGLALESSAIAMQFVCHRWPLRPKRAGGRDIICLSKMSTTVRVASPIAGAQRVDRLHMAREGVLVPRFKLAADTCRRLSMMSVLSASGAQRLVTQPADAQRSVQTTPLFKPLGGQRRPIHTLAAHADSIRPLVGSVQLDPAAANFVRPDVPPLNDEEGAGRVIKSLMLPQRASAGSNSFTSKAKFRSALEQVTTACRHPCCKRPGAFFRQYHLLCGWSGMLFTS